MPKVPSVLVERGVGPMTRSRRANIDAGQAVPVCPKSRCAAPVGDGTLPIPAVSIFSAKAKSIAMKPQAKAPKGFDSSNDVHQRAFKKWSARAKRSLWADCCHARTWRGVQCDKSKKKGELFCWTHVRSLPHGRYDNPISKEDLQKKLERGAVCDIEVDCKYYSRDKMWDVASKLEVNGVQELSDEQFEHCLVAVHEYYRANPSTRQNWQIEDGAGPRNLSERHDDGRLTYWANRAVSSIMHNLFFCGCLQLLWEQQRLREKQQSDSL